MKTFAILFAMILASTMAMDFLGTEITNSSSANILAVMGVDTSEGHYIIDQLISLEHNKERFHYTSNSPDRAAFDILLDFTEGSGYLYMNDTNECYEFGAPQMDLEAYFVNLLENNTHYKGERGAHLGVLEMNIQDPSPSRTWIYGVWTHSESGDTIFMPARFQTVESDSSEALHGEFLDTTILVDVYEEDFYYPACEHPQFMDLGEPMIIDPFMGGFSTYKKISA